MGRIWPLGGLVTFVLWSLAESILGDKAMSGGSNEVLPRSIRIAAAIIRDHEGRILLVRKHGTRFFMQPGGKLHPGETAEQALSRELQEELGCTVVRTEFLGTFFAPAANEPLHTVEALLFRASVSGEIQPSAEIEETAWIEPSRTGNLPLAPLTRDHVLPLVRYGGLAPCGAKRRFFGP